jgi:hypothetical protein
MADSQGKYNIGPPQLKPLVRTEGQKSYFFLDGVLYKKIRQDRARDELAAQNQLTKKLVMFVLSDAKRKMKPAYDTVEVAQLLNRNRATIQSYVREGKIASPVRIHEKGENFYGAPFTRMKWSEEDILALHEFLMSNGSGRPRKDGILYSAARLPSRKELMALLRSQPMFYMQTAEGEFVPVWSAYDGV